MNEACLLIVETDVLVRHPLAEYLRQCGYRVLEAANAEEARHLLEQPDSTVQIVLADLQGIGGEGFALAHWVRANHPHVQIVIAGTVAAAAEKAGDLCEDGPALAKPYDHEIVLDHIRRLLAAGERNKG